MTGKLIINSIAGEAAVCETEFKEKVFVLKYDLPKGAKEGDCLFIDKFGTIRIDMVSTKARNKSNNNNV